MQHILPKFCVPSYNMEQHHSRKVSMTIAMEQTVLRIAPLGGGASEIEMQKLNTVPYIWAIISLCITKYVLP